MLSKTQNKYIHSKQQQQSSLSYTSIALSLSISLAFYRLQNRFVYKMQKSKNLVRCVCVCLRGRIRKRFKPMMSVNEIYTVLPLMEMPYQCYFFLFLSFTLCNPLIALPSIHRTQYTFNAAPLRSLRGNFFFFALHSSDEKWNEYIYIWNNAQTVIPTNVSNSVQLDIVEIEAVGALSNDVRCTVHIFQ